MRFASAILFNQLATFDERNVKLVVVVLLLLLNRTDKEHSRAFARETHPFVSLTELTLYLRGVEDIPLFAIVRRWNRL